jgi:hypothetical protein
MTFLQQTQKILHFFQCWQSDFYFVDEYEDDDIDLLPLDDFESLMETIE